MTGMTLDTVRWQAHARLNHWHTLLLLGVMGGFLALLGWLIAGPDGLVALLIGGALGGLLNRSASPTWIMRLYGASELGNHSAPGLIRITHMLSERAGLDRPPRLFHIPSRALNAFAVGNSGNAAIAVTDGLVRALDQREMAGVLGHEISHIRNNDLRVMGLADLFSRATSLLSLFGQILVLISLPLMFFGEVAINWLAILLLVAAPGLSTLAQFALSRTREFDADLNAARLTGDPEGLARALSKIEQIQSGWLERVLMPGRRKVEPSSLRTHPSTEERIKRLMSLRLAPRDLPPAHRAWLEPEFARPIQRQPRRRYVSGLWY
ncbi:MAG: zinc metalloprotease HtpX [Gammaproteobacteria bacterium]